MTPEFEKLNAEFEHKADFLYVGCKENHTRERGALGKFNGRDTPDGPDGRWDISQPKTLEERLRQVDTWYKDWSDCLVAQGHPSMEIPYVVDGMDDQVLWGYNAYPVRFYIVKDGVCEYRGKHGPFLQSMTALRAHLEKA